MNPETIRLAAVACSAAALACFLAAFSIVAAGVARRFRREGP